MASLPDVGFDTWKIGLILYHKQLGVLALMLAALRLLWRTGNVLPRLVETLPDWQKVAARFVHLCFYALMLALPLSRPSRRGRFQFLPVLQLKGKWHAEHAGDVSCALEQGSAVAGPYYRSQSASIEFAAPQRFRHPAARGNVRRVPCYASASFNNKVTYEEPAVDLSAGK
jgi:hypothetical protein